MEKYYYTLSKNCEVLESQAKGKNNCKKCTMIYKYGNMQRHACESITIYALRVRDIVGMV